MTKESTQPNYPDGGQDHTDKWGKLLAGDESEFPTEASYANHFFTWEHTIDGKDRNQFDCTDPESFKLIPPEDYLQAYRAAKEKGEI